MAFALMRTPAILVAAGLTLAAPAPVHAGTASVEAGVARFVDPAGAGDALSVTLQNVTGQSVDPQGWNVAFFGLGTAVANGPGCQDGFIGSICPFGAAAPAGVDVDLGGGDDDATFTRADSAAGAATTVRVAGGAGNDRLATIAARAEIDGGAGDDLLLPDEVRPLAAAPPPTPGGVIRGGAGIDTVSYENSGAAVDVSLDAVANDGRKGEGDLVAPDVERIIGSRFGGTLTGSAQGNQIQGGAADDLITGGLGRDTLGGGPGNDTLDALDGAAGDVVTCGDGADLAFADAGDVVEPPTVLGARPCEVVTWAPKLSSSTLRLRSGRIRAGLSCPKGGLPCTGTLTLQSTAARPTTLAKARYTLKAGKRATLTPKPTSAGRRALRTRTVNATAVISPKDFPARSGRPIKIRR